jgi:excisionase family DNA binding protein
MARRLLSKEEVAEQFGVSPHTVRKMAYERRLRFVKVGGALRFDQRDVDAYIEANTTEAAS